MFSSTCGAAGNQTTVTVAAYGGDTDTTTVALERDGEEDKFHQISIALGYPEGGSVATPTRQNIIDLFNAISDNDLFTIALVNGVDGSEAWNHGTAAENDTTHSLTGGVDS